MSFKEVNIQELENRFELSVTIENPSGDIDVNAPHHPDLNPY